MENIVLMSQPAHAALSLGESSEDLRRSCKGCGAIWEEGFSETASELESEHLNKGLLPKVAVSLHIGVQGLSTPDLRDAAGVPT